MMYHHIPGAQFEGGHARLVMVNTREQARDHDCYFAQLTRLYAQLTDRTPAKNMHLLVGDRLLFVFIINGTNLLASATLVIAKTSTLCKGLVEDVVVDNHYRRSGLAQILMKEIIGIGRERGCHYLQLTSKPTRHGTSSLYTKAGFEIVAYAREGHPEGTNLYRYYYRRH